MTSAEIRQSFLDFFHEKKHTIVPSSSLMPDSPNLLFTNAGMNQFVPIFLGEIKCPYSPGRAADTQKCIRAGGKHNDLDDVGLDTYHHTFFEMLGNWSFGDYFKKEAIKWAWELIVERWNFPAERLYATVYSPAPGDPSEFDQEAYDFWAELFVSRGLDPKVHIVNGNKKDNFWMMGDTGPCGPCSELHVDLTPNGDTKGSLVNMGDPRCIEIWNLVFIQFNANPDGTFSPLPARHVDTGMGFERVASIIQGTRNFSDFAHAKISNYETDIFRPIFDEIEVLSGKKYTSTLPPADLSKITEQESIDIAFRVIADHIRTLSFAIADGILPGNTDRNYVLRRILRRAVRYGRTLGFSQPFFFKLVDVLARTMGDVFPELRARHHQVREVLHMEEEAFNRTLDTGIKKFLGYAAASITSTIEFSGLDATEVAYRRSTLQKELGDLPVVEFLEKARQRHPDASVKSTPILFGQWAFELYDTYGFPFDLTELMARERGLGVDQEGFENLMNKQRELARAAQKKEVISVSNIEAPPTKFVGFDDEETSARVLDVVGIKDKTAVILDHSVCYAEMGGQVGDTGIITHGAQSWTINDTRKAGDTWLHFIAGTEIPQPGTEVTVVVDCERRAAIERHHTVTHLLHWALHEVVSRDASQKGSFVGPDKLTFDFNSPALTPSQIRDVERLVNDRILENSIVSWKQVPYAEIKARGDIMQFFGDKYGDIVRVVQIGGGAGQLNGYSMELCGGTHTRATGEIGLFRILGEAAISAGVRRIEAIAGVEAFDHAVRDGGRLVALAERLNSPIAEIEKKLDALLSQHKELEKALKAAQQREAAGQARDLLSEVETIADIPVLVKNAGVFDGDALQAIVDSLKGQFPGVIVLGGSANGAVSLVAAVGAEFTAKVQAGKIIQTIAPIVGGKGGGRPDNARGGGKDPSKLDEALAQAKSFIGK
jgi:alanyl-tRNA synthetase